MGVLLFSEAVSISKVLPALLVAVLQIISWECLVLDLPELYSRENTQFRLSSMALVTARGSMARRKMKGDTGSETRMWTMSNTLSNFLCSTLSRPSTNTTKRDYCLEKASRQLTSRWTDRTPLSR